MKPIDSKRRLLDGVEQFINAALPVPTGPTGYKAKTTADRLNMQPPPSVNLSKLIDDLWRQLVVNWVEGGCKSGGEVNWRWELRDNLSHDNKSPEVVLQRNLMKLARTDPRAKERWSNETPTASGLSEDSGGEPGHLDLAYQSSVDHVTLIELKVGSNTPVSAAIQLVIYALMLVLARTVNRQIKVTDARWLTFKRADLRVLAPTRFYDAFLGLGWYERDLNEAVRQFGNGHRLEMSFLFRCFENDAELTEDVVLQRLGNAGQIDWL